LIAWVKRWNHSFPTHYQCEISDQGFYFLKF
jgi:hypothetical protein